MHRSEDNPSNAELQAYEERRLFELFAEYANLPVITDSIQTCAPPAPDILCTMRDGAKVAFELGELSDEKFRQGNGTMLQSRDLLWRAFRSLAPSYQSELQRYYASALISVQFSPTASLRRREDVLPQLFEWMASDLPERETLAPMLPTSVEGVVEKLVISRPYPAFTIEPGFATRVVPPTLRIVDKKLKAIYESEYPIELLLHMPFPFVPLAQWLQTHEQWLRAKVEGSVFRRVWVFSPAERTADTAAKLIYS